MKFYPGLVGGHCIGVDPYYLIHKSRKIGFEPNIISAGRNINDEMHNIFVKDLLEIMEKKEISIQGADIVIFGYTFKENCPDIRNTRVKHLAIELKKAGANVEIYDPIAEFEVQSDMIDGFKLLSDIEPNKYQCAIFAVAHDNFKKININELRKKLKTNSIIADLKYIFNINESDIRL